MQIKRSKGKSAPIKITRDILKRIQGSKKRLQEMLSDPLVSEDYKCMIAIILELEPYDLNILLGYYELADGSPTILSKYLNVTPNIIINRIKKLKNHVHTQFNISHDNNNIHN